jgi:hypothetical protein
MKKQLAYIRRRKKIHFLAVRSITFLHCPKIRTIVVFRLRRKQPPNIPARRLPKLPLVFPVKLRRAVIAHLKSRRSQKPEILPLPGRSKGKRCQERGDVALFFPVGCGKIGVRWLDGLPGFRLQGAV